VPPLRERKEDIPVLVEHFLRWSAHKHGRAPMGLNQEAQLALVQHPWPGNVRELENVIERGVVTCAHSILGPEDLFINHKGKPEKNDLNRIGKVARQEAERDHILQALAKAKGDKTRAARLLNISRSSLYNKLRTYQIS
jgi:DNA-binding NtrC family response regulator